MAEVGLHHHWNLTNQNLHHIVVLYDVLYLRLFLFSSLLVASFVKALQFKLPELHIHVDLGGVSETPDSGFVREDCFKRLVSLINSRRVIYMHLVEHNFKVNVLFKLTPYTYCQATANPLATYLEHISFQL